VNDPCPTAVIEAMACGVPVAYAASGGTVELVGDEAGIGVPHPDGYDRDEPPSAEALAAAVSAVLGERERLAANARRRAVERFALGDWLDRHAALFASLVE
jgi:glycosyltransferase involved in cell wall biosynthesis